MTISRDIRAAFGESDDKEQKSSTQRSLRHVTRLAGSNQWLAFRRRTPRRIQSG